jgi:hypothetical protein
VRANVGGGGLIFTSGDAGLDIEVCVKLRGQELKVRLSLQQAVEACRVVRRRGSRIVETVNAEIAVRLSALHACRSLTPTKIAGTYFC